MATSKKTSARKAPKGEGKNGGAGVADETTATIRKRQAEAAAWNPSDIETVAKLLQIHRQWPMKTSAKLTQEQQAKRMDLEADIWTTVATGGPSINFDRAEQLASLVEQHAEDQVTDRQRRHLQGRGGADYSDLLLLTEDMTDALVKDGTKLLEHIAKAIGVVGVEPVAGTKKAKDETWMTETQRGIMQAMRERPKQPVWSTSDLWVRVTGNQEQDPSGGFRTVLKEMEAKQVLRKARGNRGWVLVEQSEPDGAVERQ